MVNWKQILLMEWNRMSNISLVQSIVCITQRLNIDGSVLCKTNSDTLNKVFFLSKEIEAEEKSQYIA